ncbi:hypothetical protein JRQ81_019469, partial [Phrynocephalus forsythii]
KNTQSRIHNLQENEGLGGDTETQFDDEKDMKKDEVEEQVLPKHSTTVNFGVPPQRLTVNCVSYEPQTYQDVLELPIHDEKNWKEAMQTEFNSFKATQVLHSCKFARRERAIGCSWTYKLKKAADNS